MVVACVAITDCITSLPSALSTATEMVLWWTSRPIYLMLSIGCSFREVGFTASHSNHNLLRKGRPFIMRAPHIRAFCECVGRTETEPTNFQGLKMCGSTPSHPTKGRLSWAHGARGTFLALGMCFRQLIR